MTVKAKSHHSLPLTSCVYLVAGCITLCNSSPAADTATGEEKSPVAEKPAPVAVPKSKTPMMDILILELLKGEPINENQAKQVIGQEFGKIWNNKDPYPVVPSDSKDVGSARFHTWTYLAAVKASLLDIDNHGGWPAGYGKLRTEGFPKLMLDRLKEMAATPQNKLNRTIINFAIITPAWIVDDKEAMAMSDRQRTTDWPDNTIVARKAAKIKAMAEYMFPRK